MRNLHPSRVLNRRQVLNSFAGAAAGVLAPHRLWPSLHTEVDASEVKRETPSNLRFEEIAEKAGLQFVTRNSPTANKNQIETMVVGVALLD